MASGLLLRPFWSRHAGKTGPIASSQFGTAALRGAGPKRFILGGDDGWLGEWTLSAWSITCKGLLVVAVNLAYRIA